MENTTGQFLAGYGEADITPDYSVPLAGFGNSWRRMSERVLSHCITQCTALTDVNGTTLLMFTLDLVKVRDGFFDEVAKHFLEKYGITDEYIHINASHSESSPDTYADKEKCPCIIGYNKMVVEKIIEAGEKALSDRMPATLSYGTARPHNLNFIKHAFLDTGVSIGDNKGSPKDGRVLCHTSKVDNLLLAIRIERAGRKPITFVNWRAHNQFTSGARKTDFSADYVGAFRDAAMEKLGTELQFFQGCAGNVNPYSYIRAEERTRDYVEYGKLLTESLYDIFQDLTPIEPGLIKANKVLVTAKINHDEDDRIEEAKRVFRFYLDCPSQTESRDEAIRAGFHSAYHAMSVVNRYKAGKTMDYYLSVWSIGDLGFACTQYETFDTNGVFVRENSPFKLQFVLGYTDYPSGYMPSGYGYGYGCYEADNSMFAIGTGEKNAARTVELLIDLKYQK